MRYSHTTAADLCNPVFHQWSENVDLDTMFRYRSGPGHPSTFLASAGMEETSAEIFGCEMDITDILEQDLQNVTTGGRFERVSPFRREHEVWGEYTNDASAQATTTMLQSSNSPSTNQSSVFSTSSQNGTPNTSPSPPPPSPSTHHFNSSSHLVPITYTRGTAIGPIITLIQRVTYIDPSITNSSEDYHPNLPHVVDHACYTITVYPSVRFTDDFTAPERITLDYSTSKLSIKDVKYKAGEGEQDFGASSDCSGRALSARTVYDLSLLRVSAFLTTWAGGSNPVNQASTATKLRILISEQSVRVFATFPQLAVGQKVDGLFVDVEAKEKEIREARARQQKYWQREEEEQDCAVIERLSPNRYTQQRHHRHYHSHRGHRQHHVKENAEKEKKGTKRTRLEMDDNDDDGDDKPGKFAPGEDGQWREQYGSREWVEMRAKTLRALGQKKGVARFNLIFGRDEVEGFDDRGWLIRGGWRCWMICALP